MSVNLHSTSRSFVDFGRDFHLYCKARIILWILKKRYVRRRVGRRGKYLQLRLNVAEAGISAKLSLTHDLTGGDQMF